MRWRTLWILVIAVGLLAYLARERALRVRSGVGATPMQFQLMAEFAPERVTAVHVDSVERASQIGLERDAAGTWYLTDPIAYPASHGVIDVLLRTLGSAQGERAAALDLAALGLSPPRVVLHLTQGPDVNGEGAREFRLDVGAVDLEADRVHVRVYDHPAASGAEPFVLRATRALYSTVERNPDDYREARATSMVAQQVNSVRRHGRVWLEEQELERWVDLELDAKRAGPRWLRTDGDEVALDPNALGLVARAATELRARGFQDDSPDSFAVYGLDPPVFSVQLGDSQGDTVSLLFGFPGHDESASESEPGTWSELWYCRRLGFDHVWWIDESDVMVLVRPAEDLYDYFLVRAKREAMVRVELESNGITLTLERGGEGLAKDTWTVFEAVNGVVGTRFAAASGAVQDVLAALESTELAFPEGAALEENEATSSITLVTDDGTRWGGLVGGLHKDTSTGLVGHTFLRYGDRRVAAIPEAVSELLDLEIDDLRSSRIHRVRPEDVAQVELRFEDRTFTYVQSKTNEWSVRPSGFPAPNAFVSLTLHLFSLSAEEWLPTQPARVAQPIDVKVSSRQGEALEFRLARDENGGLLCRSRGAWARVATQSQLDLWERDLGEVLRELFQD